jgi:hypothetical protein
MKAILMFGDMFMKVMEIDRIRPEIVLPIARVMNVNTVGFLDGYDTPDDMTVVIKMTFRLETPGHTYAVYQLKGFDK